MRFQQMVSGKEQYEVCRLFLASLQLVRRRVGGWVGGWVSGCFGSSFSSLSLSRFLTFAHSITHPPTQQANNGNVQLVHQESNKDANGLSFRMKLLSDQRMHERFTGTELGSVETQH